MSVKPSGPEKIPMILINDVTDLISKPLTMMFHSSLRRGVYPDIWKVAKITLFSNQGLEETQIIIGPSQ